MADIRIIIDDDNRLQKGIDQALREYNIAQFVTVQAPNADHQVRHTGSMLHMDYSKALVAGHYQ
jgi:F-actin capping protein alpha subunit